MSVSHKLPHVIGMAWLINSHPAHSVYYTLATISPAAEGKPAAPHARYVVHRGFVNEQRSKDSPSGVEPHNPDFGSNALLLTTTDVRAPKARQIVESAKEGGANGEICWWHESSQMQVRRQRYTS